MVGGSRGVAEGGNMWLEVRINKRNSRNKKETYLGPKQCVWRHLGLLLLSQPPPKPPHAIKT
jgi:hypothetical protein